VLDPVSTIAPSASLFSGDGVPFTAICRTVLASGSGTVIFKSMFQGERVHTVPPTVPPMISIHQPRVNRAGEPPAATLAEG
jgi:hypothetical protein